MAKQVQMEKRFASFLMDRIDENLKGMQGENAAQIRLHLNELRTVVVGEEEGGANA